MVEEKRRAERIITSLPVRIGGSVGITRDVSASGVFFEADTDYSIGNPIRFEVEFATPSGSLVLRCAGHVVRVEMRERRVGVAVRIADFAVEPATLPS
jgi:PilZ domain-containing protein